MPTLIAIPVDNCRMRSDAVLEDTCQRRCPIKRGKQLTSQRTTVPGSQRTRTWCSKQRAIWLFKNPSNMSLSSFFIPTMCVVTASPRQPDQKPKGKKLKPTRIDKKCLLPCNWMSADKRMLYAHWLSAHQPPIPIIWLYLRYSIMHAL